MVASFLEIVELPSGEIVLRRSDGGDDEPLLTLNFSEEAKKFLQGCHLDIAKLMFDVGIEEVSRQSLSQDERYGLSEERVLH
ncbi:MAG: hypothetical protein QS748_00640 [Candidatus Endonucleobacter bathymodioli]|uniref:Uncharacterized protein n=1 Tax=Candidatus Endonucleibacter bathymodioli TaxID=539814 RepID=A0AA90NVV0_9GAMM|nr:hypothetical protein [Candidatus Endonucleobacter bathymodioli]